MANMIEQNPIAGASVYGVEQYSYTVDGVAGKDYAAALSAASFKEAVAIEQALSAYSEVVRQRMRKLDDLGTVMAILNEAYATLKTKEQESGDTTGNMVSLATARDKAALYGVTINITDIAIPELGIRMCYTTRRDLMNAQNAVQYAIDKEDNELKQDTVSLNSYVSKRDNSFSTASKLVRKALDASGSTIGNIG
ncbi:MAG: hypothetical protein IJG18_12610 [Kiritimatiellae bacterium]|nr:hypothetical protein [Kiritimatiellia bacterium]